MNSNRKHVRHLPRASSAWEICRVIFHPSVCISGTERSCMYGMGFALHMPVHCMRNTHEGITKACQIPALLATPVRL